ncbi:hypothetical protein IA64_03715 [Xanthomonas arboricola pv. celebensis]|nr:hypothetical protein IA64_03715 [Xanthomonas arboricola pv. celebensis]
MKWVSAIALTVTTLWVLILGYRIATGQSRENAMATMIKAAKGAIIISVASALGVNGAMLHQTMTQNLDKEIHRLFTGKESTAADAIDKDLAFNGTISLKFYESNENQILNFSRYYNHLEI